MEADELLDRVEEFLAQTGMNATAFGKAALSDPTFVFDLRKGRECRRSVRQRVSAFMQDFSDDLRRAG